MWMIRSFRPGRWRRSRGRDSFERLWLDLQFLTSGCEDAIRLGDASNQADPVYGRALDAV